MNNTKTKGTAPQRKIRVLTVDDHDLMRHGIGYVLKATEDIELVAEARSGQEALQACEQARPDVVLMDMNLGGGMDGVATTREIRTRHPNIQVLVLSSFSERERVQGALQAGAIGYLVKDVSGSDLTSAIRAARLGQSTLSAEPLRGLIQSPASVEMPGSDLTEREREVLSQLVEGASNAQIAEKLVVSVAAVKYHVSSILVKLGATNRTEAASIARQYNLVPKKD